MLKSTTGVEISVPVKTHFRCQYVVVKNLPSGSLLKGVGRVEMVVSKTVLEFS